MLKSEKTLWQIIKIGITYNEYKSQSLKEKIIFNIIIQTPLLIILDLFMYYNELINTNFLIITLFVILSNATINIYRLWSNNSNLFAKSISKHQIKLDIFRDTILVLGFIFIYIFFPYSQESLSITGFYIILGVIVPFWLRTSIFALSFLKSFNQNQ